MVRYTMHAAETTSLHNVIRDIRVSDHKLIISNYVIKVNATDMKINIEKNQ
jgi:hypothetical protein